MSQFPPMQNPASIIDMAKVRERLQAASLEALNASVLILSSAMRTTLSQPGTGRRYFRNPGYGRRRNARQQGVHVASAPGRPPAVDTNRLRASFAVSTVGTRGDGFVAVEKAPTRMVLRYGSKVRYAVFLEYGTRRTRKRPFVAPTLEKFRPKLPAIFAAAFRRHFPRVKA